MRVLIVSSFYPPQAAIASRRVHTHAQTWSRLGADVTVLTTAKRDDQRTDPRESGGVRVEEIAVPASPVVLWARRLAGDRGLRAGQTDAGAPGRMGRLVGGVRSRTGIYSGIRMPDVTDAWVEPAVRHGRALSGGVPFDVVFASSGPYTTLRVADGIVCAGAARRFVAEFRDLWTANHSARGCVPFRGRERAIERSILGRVDRVVTVSDALAGWLRGRTAAPVDVIYNGHGGRRPRSIPRDATVFKIAYTGAVYERGHDLGPFMSALAVLRASEPAMYERVRVVVAGGSGEVFAAAARRVGVQDRLELLGEVSHEQSLEIQNRADVLLSLEWTGPEGGVLTGKVFEYLACGAPILVVGPCREISELVIRCGRGAHAGDDPAAIAEALSDAASGAMERSLIPDESLIDSFSRERQSARLYEMLLACVGSAEV